MWIMRRRVVLGAEEHTHLQQVLGRCNTLRAVDELVSDFAGMAR
jgi:hypothetical protein